MFSITTTRLAGVVATCALVVAPQALAKPLAHSAKADAKRVHRVPLDDPAVSTAGSTAKLSALPTAFVGGCRNGTIGDCTKGGDNNNYDYYGDPCTT